MKDESNRIYANEKIKYCNKIGFNYEIYDFPSLPPGYLIEILQRLIFKSFSISILSPLLAEIFIKLVVNKKSGKVTEFLAYKITMCAIGFVLVLILAFLWIGKYKGLFILQFIMGIVSIVISFYIYCVLQMDSHMNVVGEYDDNEYLTKEKERMSGIDEEAKTIIRGKDT